MITSLSRVRMRFIQIHETLKQEGGYDPVAKEVKSITYIAMVELEKVDVLDCAYTNSMYADSTERLLLINETLHSVKDSPNRTEVNNAFNRCANICVEGMDAIKQLEGVKRRQALINAE